MWLNGDWKGLLPLRGQSSFQSDRGMQGAKVRQRLISRLSLVFWCHSRWIKIVWDWGQVSALSGDVMHLFGSRRRSNQLARRIRWRLPRPPERGWNILHLGNQDERRWSEWARRTQFSRESNRELVLNCRVHYLPLQSPGGLSRFYGLFTGTCGESYPE